MENHQPQNRNTRGKAAVVTGLPEPRHRMAVPGPFISNHPKFNWIELTNPKTQTDSLGWKDRPKRQFSGAPWPCCSLRQWPFLTKPFALSERHKTTRQLCAASRRHILALKTKAGAKWGYRRWYYKQTAAKRKWMWPYLYQTKQTSSHKSNKRQRWTYVIFNKWCWNNWISTCKTENKKWI